jgi:hypothetical protein
VTEVPCNVGLLSSKDPVNRDTVISKSQRVFCDGRSSIHSQLDLTMMQRKALLDEEHCLFKDHTKVIKQDVLEAVSTVRRGGTV